MPDDAEDVTNNNRMRGTLDAVLSTLRLFSADLAVRRAAIVDLGKATLEEGQLPLINDKALAAETDPQLKDNLGRDARRDPDLVVRPRQPPCGGQGAR